MDKTPIQSEDTVNVKAERGGVFNTLNTGITRKAAAAALALGVGIGVAGCAPGQEVNEQPQPVATDEAIIDNTMSEENLTKLSKSLEIPAGLDATAFSQEFLGAINEWRADPLSPEELDRLQLMSDMAPADFYADRAQKTAPALGSALFGANWESTPGAQEFIDGVVKRKAYTLETWVLTTVFATDEDIEPFSASADFQSASEITNPDGSRTIEITYLNTSNTDMNRVPDTIEGTGIFTVTVTSDESGIDRVTSITRD